MLALLSCGLLLAFFPSTGQIPEIRSLDIQGVKRLAFLPTPHGWPVSVATSGNHVLLSNGETWRGLQNINWRDVSAPHIEQTFDTGNTNAAMVMLGNRVYVLANYHGITMFDMDADGKLTRIGRWRLPPPADHGRMMVGLQRDGRQYLYLSIKPEGNWKDWPVNPAIPEPGLYMLDVTDAKDIQVYHLGKQPMFSTIAEGYGYIIQGSRLDIYALDRPTSPRRISGYQATGNITGLSIEQGHAWLTVQGSSLELIDVNEAYAPRLLAQSNEGDMRHATSLAAQGDWAYVLESGIGYDGPDGGMHVFHWHDGQLQHIRHATWGRSNMQRITLAGNAAYVTDQYYGLWRFDISQPDLPQRGALFMSAGENQQLLIEKNIGLLNLEWGGTVGILDASDPLHIGIKGYYRPGRFDDYAVGISGSYFYFGKHASRRIIDIHDPANPTEAGEWKLPGQPLMPPQKWRHLFYEWLRTGKQQISLLAFDMGNPLHPRQIGNMILPEELSLAFGSSATDGQRMFAVADNGIVSVDISDPARMQITGIYSEQGIGARAPYTWQGSGRRTALNGDYLYVIQGAEDMDSPHIAVIDVSDTKHMRRVHNTADTPPAFQDDWFDERLLHQGDMLNDMVIHDGKLYVSDYWGGIRIYDCSIPFRPRLSHWEFQPYLSLLPADWSRQRYKEAVASGKLHKSLNLDTEKWEQRHVIGHRLWDRPLEYHPGYELFGWNIGGFVGQYLLQPKLGGIAVYRISDTVTPSDSTKN